MTADSMSQLVGVLGAWLEAAPADASAADRKGASELILSGQLLGVASHDEHAVELGDLTESQMQLIQSARSWAFPDEQFGDESTSTEVTAAESTVAESAPGYSSEAYPPAARSSRKRSVGAFAAQVDQSNDDEVSSDEDEPAEAIVLSDELVEVTPPANTPLPVTSPDDTPPANIAPAVTSPADTPPANTPLPVTSPDDTPPANIAPAVTSPDDTPLADIAPAVTSPADTSFEDTAPAVTSPADTQDTAPAVTLTQPSAESVAATSERPVLAWLNQEAVWWAICFLAVLILVVRRLF